MSTRLRIQPFTALAIALPALALPVAVAAQNYSDMPPLAPMSVDEVRTLPVEYRTAPAMSANPTTQTTIGADGVETITRTRRIDGPPPLPPPRRVIWGKAIPTPMPRRWPMPRPCSSVTSGSMNAGAHPRAQQERHRNHHRRIARRDRGRFGGYEIAGAGDRVLAPCSGLEAAG